jgi:GTPase
LRSLRAIERADVVLVVLNSSEGAAMIGDLKIASHADEFGKGLAFVANKWDLVKSVPQEEFTRLLFFEAPMLKYASVVFTSALKGKGVPAIIKTIDKIDKQRKRHIQTAQLNQFLEKAVTHRQPPARGGKLIKFYYMTQAKDSPPTFIFFTNHPKHVDPSYQRYLENQLREQFGFEGTPVSLIFKPRR